MNKIIQAEVIWGFTLEEINTKINDMIGNGFQPQCGVSKNANGYRILMVKYATYSTMAPTIAVDGRLM